MHYRNAVLRNNIHDNFESVESLKNTPSSVVDVLQRFHAAARSAQAAKRSSSEGRPVTVS